MNANTAPFSLKVALASPAGIFFTIIAAYAIKKIFFSKKKPVFLPCGIRNDNQSFQHQNEKPLQGHGVPRRSHLAKENYLSFVNGEKNVKTLYDIFEVTCKKFGSRPYLGTRTVNKDGSAGPYQWITYNQTHERANNFGCGLKKSFSLERGAFIGFYLNNKTEWVIAEKGCNAYSFVNIPLYDTLGKDAVEYIFSFTGLPVVIATKDHIKTLIAIKPKCPNLVGIIQIESEKDEESAQQTLAAGIKLFTFAEIEKIGESSQVPHEPPKPDDISTICFTSGTTGTPKGAMLSHFNLTTEAASIIAIGVDLNEYDVLISYLPLAHVFERVVQAVVTYCGSAIGFYRGDVQKLMDDIGELKPTLFPSVPRLFNRIHDTVRSNVDKAGGISKKLFEFAMKTKRENLKYGSVTHAIWDRLVFSKVKARLGGRVRLIVSASAPLSEEVMAFLRCAFGCTVLEAYGQTENTGAATCTIPGDCSIGHVGAPLPNMSIKLCDVPEMNYFANSNPPCGEICFFGHNVFKGYYNDIERTKEAFPEGDGWLHSGDIGTWLPNGTLKIIDRKKNIFKLAHGEYVAPEKLENVYTLSKFVAQIYVHGVSTESQLVAIVVPSPDALMKWWKEEGAAACGGSADEDITSVCRRKETNATILKDIQAAGKKNGLNGIEIVHAIVVEPTAFSLENDLLTPTFKPKRNVLSSVYKVQLNQMYEELHKINKSK